MKEFTDIQIDPEHPRLRRFTRQAVSVLFVTACIAVAGGTVWILGFRSHQPSLVESNSVVQEASAYPTVELSLSDVALVIDRGESSMIKAYVKHVIGSPEVDSSSVRLRWVSECPTVVSVDTSGNITAHNPGIAFVNVSVANRDIHSNTTRCLVTVRENASHDDTVEIGEGIDVFDGSALYDEKKHLIVFRDVKKFVIKGKSNHYVTMRPGDRIYDVRIRRGCLISGKFVKGSNSSTIKGINEPL